MEEANPFLEFLGAPQHIRIRQDIERICIYCKAKLPSKSNEHLFNACWGGTLMSSKLICDECNAAFSRIDGCFQSFTAWIMNTHGFGGNRPKGIPEIELGSHIVARFGRLISPEPKIEESKDADGNHQIQIHARTRSELRRILLDGKLEKSIGRKLSSAERANLLRGVSEAKTKLLPLDPIKTQVTIDIQSQYRATAHTLLKVLKMYGSNLWCDSSTEELRSFAHTGSASYQDFAINAELPISVADIAKRSSNYRVNSVEIYWSHCERKIFGVLTILGRIKRALVISESWQGPNAIMIVGESVHAGARLKAISWKFPPEANAAPIIIPSEVAPTPGQIASELGDLMNENSGWQPIVSELGHKLSRITSKGGHLSRRHIDRIEQVLSNTLRRYAAQIDRLMDQPAAIECLQYHSFRKRIERFLAQPIDNPDWEQVVGDVLIECFQSITPDNSSAA